jgi:hypothetical protein
VTGGALFGYRPGCTFVLIKGKEFLDHLSDNQLLRKKDVPWSE